MTAILLLVGMALGMQAIALLHDSLAGVHVATNLLLVAILVRMGRKP